MIGYKETFTEDVFDFKYKGNNNTSYPQEIILLCENKKSRVSGTLNNGIKTSAKAEWKDMMGGGIMSLGGSLVETGNNFVQWANAESIQQPWMNRKMWVTTRPLTFKFSISFVEIDDAIKDVVQPCIALLSFVYPREAGTSENDENGNAQGKAKTMLTVLNELTGEKSKGNDGKYRYQKNSGLIPEKGLVGKMLNSLAIYAIPGPGLRFGSSSATARQKGDNVTIIVGNMLCLTACYIDSVDIEFHNVLNNNGYPIGAKADVSVTSMDSCYTNSSGNFLISGFSDSANRLASFLDQFSKTANDLVRGVVSTAESIIGFYKPSAENDSKAKEIQKNRTELKLKDKE